MGTRRKDSPVPSPSVALMSKKSQPRPGNCRLYRIRHWLPVFPGSFTIVPSTMRSRRLLLLVATSTPVSPSRSTDNLRNHSSLFRSRFSSATSETFARCANLACTAVSRSDKPFAMCSNSVLSNASAEEKPRRRSMAPLSTARSRHCAGNKDNRVCQFS